MEEGHPVTYLLALSGLAMTNINASNISSPQPCRNLSITLLSAENPVLNFTNFGFPKFPSQDSTDNVTGILNFEHGVAKNL